MEINNKKLPLPQSLLLSQRGAHFLGALVLLLALIAFFVATNPAFTAGTAMSPIAVTLQPDDLVVMVFGQSHSGNSMDVLQTAGALSAVKYNPADGNFYQAADPLPDGSGGGGSFLTLLGHQYSALAVKPLNRLVIVPGVANGTGSSEWLPANGTLLQTKVIAPYNNLIAAGATSSQIIGMWVQGSSDVNSGVSAQNYQANWSTILGTIRNAGIAMPIFIAETTHCRLSEGAELELITKEQRVAKLKAQAVIHNAQVVLPNAAAGTYAGPDFDFIGSSGRHDYCHFGAWGGQVAAELALQTLLDAAGTIIPLPLPLPPPPPPASGGIQTSFSLTLDSDYANNTVRTIRSVIPAAYIEVSGSQVRVKFVQSSGTGGRSVSNASIVEQVSGAAGVAAPTRLTFIGTTTATLSNVAPLWSDWTDFALDANKSYLVSWDQPGGNTMRARQKTGSGFGAYAAPDQRAMQQSAAGFSLVSSGTTIGVSEIQTQ